MFKKFYRLRYRTLRTFANQIKLTRKLLKSLLKDYEEFIKISRSPCKLLCSAADSRSKRDSNIRASSF